MNQSIKDNLVPIAGIALPLILAAVFLVAQKISLAGIEPPQTAVVFAVGYDKDNAGNLWDVFVKGQEIHVTRKTINNKDGNYYGGQPRLFLHRPGERTSSALDYPPLSKEEQDGKKSVSRTILLPAPLKISTDEKSPDGYVFVRNERRNDAGFLFDVFGGNNRRDRFVLQKGAYNVTVPQSQYQSSFIGWAITE